MKKHTRKFISFLTAMTLITGSLLPTGTVIAEGTAEENEIVTEISADVTTEAGSEADTEYVTEASTEAASEAVTECVSEETVEESETVTEGASEAVTESSSETVTESSSEAATESSSEVMTETITEAASETESETITETDVENVFNVNIDQETELVSEILDVEEVKTLNEGDDGNSQEEMDAETPDMTTAAGLAAYAAEIPTAAEIAARYVYRYSNAENYQAYQNYRNAAIAKAETAYTAYQALSSEEKNAFKALTKENGSNYDTDMYNVWVLGNFNTFTTDESLTFTRSSDVDANYVYKFSSDCYYQGSMHAMSGDNVVAFLLVDTSKYGSWSPNTAVYQTGASNYEVAFCCDNDTSAVEDYAYKRVNLEDSTYYEKADAEKIRAIVQNSYPFISEAAMAANLVANGVITDPSSLDTSQLLSATQAAIWHYANGESYAYSETYNTSLNYYSNELAADTDYNLKNTDNEISTNIQNIYNYLISLAPVSTGTSMVISDVSYEAYKVDAADQFHVAVKVTLNTEVKSGDAIQVSASVEGKEISSVVSMTSGSEIVLNLSGVEAGDEIRVEVSGTQNLEKNVYFYEPWADPESEDYTANRRSSSQSLVGVSSGATAVYAAKSFNIDDAEVSASLTIHKTNGAKTTALAGAEFELSYVEADGTTAAVMNGSSKTFTTDAEGNLVFESLIPGNYILKETKAPEGYMITEDSRETRFELSIDGESTKIVLSNGETNASADGNVLTLTNDAAKGSGKITVTKQIGYVDPNLKDMVELFAKDAVFYVGIFKDAEGTVLYGENPVREIQVQGESAGSVTFENLAEGTYYIFETDADGNAIPVDQMQTTADGNWMCQVIEGSQQKVEFTSVAASPEASVEICNSYYYIPEGFYLEGEIEISKSVLVDGKTAVTADTFYAGIFANETDAEPLLMTEIIQNGTVTVSVPLGGENGNEDITYYVYEVDADGNKVGAGFAYEVSGEGAVLVSRDTTAKVELVNEMIRETETEIKETESETETQETETETETELESETESESETELESESETEKETVKETEKETEKTVNTVKTGDDTNIILYVLIAVAALLGLVLLGCRKIFLKNR